MMILDENDKPICISLNPEQIKWCFNHAKNTHEYAEKNISTWAYNGSRINGHLVGVKSELAVSVFLTNNSFKVNNYFKLLKDGSITSAHDGIDRGDLVVNERNIEVKGCNERNWERYKRQIPPMQLEKYVSKNAIVVWTTVENHEHPRNKVLLRGWNFAHEVEDKGEYIKTICDNIKLYNDKDMNPMPQLIRVLNKEDKSDGTGEHNEEGGTSETN
jgi:hypothetical protein